jgi:hypothetical protein
MKEKTLDNKNIDQQLFKLVHSKLLSSTKIGGKKIEENENLILPTTDIISGDILPNVLPLPVSPSVSMEAVVNILNKQSEMITGILNILVQQNEAIKTLLTKETKIEIPREEYRDKIINLRFDERGNPVGAEIKLKPFDESKLDLETLETQDIIEGVEIPK